MICVTVGRTRHKRMLEDHASVAEQGAELVELRLDYIGRSVDLPRLLKDRPTQVIATCRRRNDGGRWEKSEEERLMLLRSAIASNVEYVDLEDDVADKIPRYGRTKRIVSYHDFSETPDDLEAICDRLASKDADIVKIATMANSFADVVAMLDLVRHAKRPTIGIAMGDIGTITLVLGPRYGSPFTYCALNTERKVAPGQITFDQMKSIFRLKEIDRETRVFGVIADPVAHSLSPIIHNAAFESQNINARYIPLRVPAEDLEYFLRWARQYPVAGLSVTIPHKEAILPLLNQAEAAAQGIGAANTVVFDQSSTTGYNTDYRAAMDCISKAFQEVYGVSESLKGHTALVLGAGGVSRAVAYGLVQRGATVVISSRTEARADALAAELDARTVPWQARHDLTPTLVVNGTPVGMFPDVDESPFDSTRLDDSTIVFDTVYNPELTMFIRRARDQGCHIITGIDMFVGQAAYQYKLFSGLEPPVETMRKALRQEISHVKF